MLITVLIVIAVLLALILFTIAAANPNAFWGGVGWILTLAIVGGILVGGYYTLLWAVTLDWSKPFAVLEAAASGLMVIILIGGLLFFAVSIVFALWASRATILGDIAKLLVRVFWFVAAMAFMSLLAAAIFFGVWIGLRWTGLGEAFPGLPVLIAFMLSFGGFVGPAIFIEPIRRHTALAQQHSLSDPRRDP